ncbi:hypothetical protein BgiBS90_001273 [Biomphalaria glabrata]|nr:hypothetical protein BgiBS90_001273 [Biomphalaria glabrata]
MNEETETRGKHLGKSNYRLNKCTFSAANSTNLSSKQQIFLGSLLSDDSFLFGIFMNWGFQGQNLLSIFMATQILTSKHSVANSTNLSSYPSNYYSLTKWSMKHEVKEKG